MDYIKGRIDDKEIAAKYSGLKENLYESTAVTLGKFDGLHRGHMLLIDTIIKQNLKSVLFTFEINSSIRQIYTLKEKKDLVQKAGLDVMIEYPFDDITKNMKPDMFIEKVLYKALKAKVIVVGDDFRFGYNRSGDINVLEKLSKKFDYKLIVIEKMKNVSSTNIRKELLNSNIELANNMLGRAYSIDGLIIKGNAIGRTIGIPTINILPEKNKILPRNGVYASKIYINDNIYSGITNIGHKPTITGENDLGVETHIFNFNEDVYGKNAKVEILKYIRPEKTFCSIDALKKQMNNDIEYVKKFKG